MKKVSLAIVSIFVLPNLVLAQITPDNTAGRLWWLDKVWGYLKYYHPSTCNIKWDSLLYTATSAVIVSSSNINFNQKLERMMDYLGQIPPGYTGPTLQMPT